MKRINKLFNDIEMNYKRVIIFALIVAIYTAAINLIPALRNTSFQDIAINPECWILFALIIILNCDNYKEAALKCFIFFLVSQPLIYLIEAPFDPLGFGIFMYYKRWFVITLLTIPGAIIAYQLKRKDILSVIVLSIANIYLIIQAIEYLKSCINNFPNHLLSMIFCILLSILLIFVVFDKKIYRIICLLIVLLTGIIYSSVSGLSFKTNATGIYLKEGNWTYKIDNQDICDIEITDGNRLVINRKNNGYAIIRLENESNEVIEYAITINGKQIIVNEITD